MKKILFYLFVLISLHSELNAQNCGSTTLSEIIPLETEIMGTVAQKKINVYWYVVRTDAGVMQNDVSVFENLIEDTKTEFESSSIDMGDCILINFIDSDILYNVNSPSELCLFDNHCEEDGLNVFLIEGNIGNVGGAHIAGNKCFIKVDNTAASVPVICHEIGHCFGLFHTHAGREQSHQLFGGTVAWQCDAQDGVNAGRSNFSNACNGASFQRNWPFEMADGSNGSTAGDFVSDTPADINLIISQCDVNPYSECSFDEDSCDNLLEDDQRKDPSCNMLSPDWSNFMRGSGIGVDNAQCWDHFTTGQVQRMHGVIENFLSHIIVPVLGQSITQDRVLEVSREFLTNVWVSSGATLTIKNATIKMAANKNINIGADCKLILDNAIITSCEDKWTGITCNENALGVDLTNNSIVENAQIGIKLKKEPFTSGLPIDPNTPHPNLYMKNSHIWQSNIGIQFGYGKTESQITGSSSIAQCEIGIKYLNHSGLIIEECDIGNSKEGIYALDGHFTLLDNVRFWGGNINPPEVGISAEGTLPLAAGLDIGSENSVTIFIAITEAGIIANGLEHPTGANVTNCAFGFSSGGGVAAAFSGYNDFEFVNNSISDIERGAFVFATGGNPNNVNCNEYKNVEVASNISFFVNGETNFLENHYLGDQNINFALVTSLIPTQGLATNPAANCFSDPGESDHILNLPFLAAPPTSFLYHYYDDSNEANPCQIPDNPQDYTAQSHDNQGTGHCDGDIGIFNLISPGGPGSTIGIDPQHDDPDVVCLPCIDDAIDDWIDNVVNTGGDDPRTPFDESDSISDPALPANEAILHQWISYAIYVALETGDFAYGAQVLAPLSNWKWRTRLYGLYVLEGDLVRADQVLDLLPQATDDHIQFKQVQKINLKRIQQIPITPQEIDDIHEIAIGTEPSHGYARSLYRALTGIRLPLGFPETIGRNGPRSDRNIENKLIIYPNPTSGSLHLSRATVMQEITILDIAGKIVMKEKMNANTATLDMTSLNKGIYILQILDDKETMTAKKIIKL